MDKDEKLAALDELQSTCIDLARKAVNEAKDWKKLSTTMSPATGGSEGVASMTQAADKLLSLAEKAGDLRNKLS